MSINIWNNIDELALYLSLYRLDGETNDEFVNRIKIFSKWKYKTDYYTQVHSIPLQLGLETRTVGRLQNLNNNKFRCDIEWDYFLLKEILPDGTVGEYIRIFLEGKFDTIRSISDIINNSQTFRCNIYKTTDLDIELGFLVRNKNIKIDKFITNALKYDNFGKTDILPGSVRVNDPSYRRLISSVDGLSKSGDYYIDWATGFIQTFDAEPEQTDIMFQYYDKAFSIETTEMNLIPVNRYFAYGLSDDSINMIPYLLNNIIVGE